MISQGKKTILWLFGFCLMLINLAEAQSWDPSHRIGPTNGVFHYSSSQVPADIVELLPAAAPNTGLTYQWEFCLTPAGTFISVSGATSSSLHFTTSLPQTTYYRRKTTNASSQSIYSNVVKIQLVSANWEDLNYIRSHDVHITGKTTGAEVDVLPIGDKLQSTSYMDGLGRIVQQVNREMATPAVETDPWADVVRFAQHDAYGRQTKGFLPYATSSQSGKFKDNTATDQPAYYNSLYSETPAYSSLSFDNSPLNRVLNVKKPGAAWSAGSGNSVGYDMNNDDEEVQQFRCDYTQGNAPVHVGAYLNNKLYKITYTDEHGKQVIEYTDWKGNLILKKIQLDDSPTAAHNGWICTYSIYDEYGQLRFQLQPEAVKYLDNNNWSFSGTNGTNVLNGLCFQYFYDDNGRLVWKKKPGAEPLKMIYDKRNRLVFSQDGNQSVLSTPQWTMNLYDEFDRIVATALYNTTKTIANLQSDIDAASPSTSITISNADNTGGGTSIVLTLSFCPVTSTNLNTPSVCAIQKYLFYDAYGFNGVRAFYTAFTNTNAYSTSDPNVQAITSTKRTLSMETGSRIRLLGSNKFYTSTIYYDQRGDMIQSLVTSIKGVDFTTFQHHFDGRVLSVCTQHTATGSGYNLFEILTKNNFDKIGRITSVQKKYGSNAFKTISSLIYDELGRVKTKKLDPDYTVGGSDGLETLNYSFNIQGQLTGINKDYALKSGAYDKWDHFFGMYLGFDNSDNVFANAKLNGQVTGLMWNSRGDDAQRKYDYTYDNAGRLVKADYNEKGSPSDSWSNTKMDFSVSGTSGQITYDLNGNLLTMLQKGVMPGNSSPVTIDDLRYTYESYNNRLKDVKDEMTATTDNGKLGDLKDGSNGSAPDYVYDDNGNVIVDLNKSVENISGSTPGSKGVSYNYLNKPELIRLPGKGTIRIVYDADGTRLQRAFIPEGGGSTQVYTTINGFTYKETSTTVTATSTLPMTGPGVQLAYINFEEGRIRAIEPVAQDDGLAVHLVDGNITLPNSREGVFDYFIMDYQQNVRMVLTEESRITANTCTMETARSTLEESIFGQVGAANEVQTTRYEKPSTWDDTDVGEKVSRLGTDAGYSVGPNTLQKVMAGDAITAHVQYYHQSLAMGNDPNFLSNVIGTLVQAISGGNAASGLVKGNAAAIGTQLNGVPNFVDAVLPDGANPTGTRPQAYLTLLFFDERFNFVGADNGGMVQYQVEATVGTGGGTLTIPTTKAPKNGYAYVYVSNQSDEHVYFDNLMVNKVDGNIAEENHYYAFGLKVAAISSRKLGDGYEGELKNNYLYNDKEFFDDADINWYDYGYRNYDPQIGRFAQIDPIADVLGSISPYHYAYNDPITNTDLNGLIGIPCPGTSGLAIFLGNVASSISNIVAASSTAISIIGMTSTVTTTSIAVVQTIQISDQINNSIVTNGVGNNNSSNILTYNNENSAITNDLGNDIEEEVRRLIYKENYEEATKRIIDHFPELGFVEKSKYQYKFAEGNGMTTKNKSFKDDTQGKYIQLASILMGKRVFTSFASGKNKFGDLVRAIYHELIHVEQLLGLNGKPALPNDDQRPEREFLAYYETIMNKTLPELSDVVLKIYLELALTDKWKDQDGKQLGNFYNRMSDAKQKEHLSKKITLEKLLKSLNKVK